MIQVRALSRYYGRRCAVESVSFSIAQNEVVGILGLNGAGKTTTLKVLAGLMVPSSGSVLVDGVDMGTAPVEVRGRIGFLPEDPPLYGEMTVCGFLRFVGALRGMSGAELDARLPTVIEKTCLDEYKDRVIDELSHGYRKRVGIAQAIIHRPKLVILDEPISGLDPVQIVEMREVIRGLGRESTVLVSSHILSEISQTCDRILVLDSGRLVAQGTEAELAGRFRTRGRIELELRGEASAISALLGGLDYVEGVQVDEPHNGCVDVRLTLSEDAGERLVAALVGAGIGVRRVADARDELEEIFLDLTREGAA